MKGVKGNESCTCDWSKETGIRRIDRKKKQKTRKEKENVEMLFLIYITLFLVPLPLGGVLFS